MKIKKKIMGGIRVIATVILALTITPAFSTNSFASANNSYDVQNIDWARYNSADLCSYYFPHYEKLYGIPVNLLAAIAEQESGRWSKESKKVTPWPWTIGASGEGHYLGDITTAVAKVNNLKSRGVRNMDLGCMQVNMHHHSGAFSNINQAFDPRYNINYAASFLRKLYDETGSWARAVMYYHSRTPEHGNKYASRVIDRWRQKMGISQTSRAYGTQGVQVASLNRQSPPSLAPATSGAQALSKPKVISMNAANNKARKDVMVIRVASADSSDVRTLRADKPAGANSRIVKNYSNTGNNTSGDNSAPTPRVINFASSSHQVREIKPEVVRMKPINFIFN
jgi:hypothetical protein